MKNKAAQELGRMARGIPKNYTKAERQRRRERMLALNAARKKTGSRKKGGR